MSKLGLKDKLDRLGNVLVSGFQVTALFVIGATIVWSATNPDLDNDGRAFADGRGPCHLLATTDDRFLQNACPS